MSMEWINKKNIWQLVAFLTSILISMGIKKVLNNSWKSIKQKDPPKVSTSDSVAWADAITWTITTAIISGLAKLFAERFTFEGWKQVIGEDPDDY